MPTFYMVVSAKPPLLVRLELPIDPSAIKVVNEAINLGNLRSFLLHSKSSSANECIYKSCGKPENLVVFHDVDCKQLVKE